jgi:hypothetical protein
MVQGSRQERRGKAARCADLDRARRRENARHRGEKEKFLRPDRAGVMDCTSADLLEKFDLAGRRRLSGSA